MTTIVYHNGTFAWDTQTTWQYRAMNGGDKVFVNGPVTFAVAGSSRSSDVLTHMDIPDMDSHKPGFDTVRWIVRKLVPAILKATDEAAASEIVNNQADIEAPSIISVNGVVGYLSNNLAFVRDDSGYYGIGSGSTYALGALKAGATPKEAVKIAASFDLYTGGKIRTLKV